MTDWQEKACVGCGAPFSPKNFRQKRCKPNCKRTLDSKNGKRRNDRELHDVEFIAVDGEGVTRKDYYETVDEETGEVVVKEATWDRHDYVLLSVGDQSLHKNGRELNHDDIFSFLWEQFEAHPTATFVGFALGYDFTMWFKSLDARTAWLLLTKEGIASRQPRNEERTFPFPVRDGGWRTNEVGQRYYVKPRWEFDILGYKRFKLRPYVAPEDVPTRVVNHKDGTQSEQKVVRPWMYICDTFPFFQSSFLKAIKPDDAKGIKRIVSDEEYERIAAGKEIRSSARFDEEMIEYNLLENEVLARLLNTLNEGFVADQIRLRKNQWMGPGQAAQEWMKLIGVPSGEETREAVPNWALEAARKTYYGGWFEIFNHGPVPGTSYAYDINSAYPAIIATLPCLLHGKWSRGSRTNGRMPRLSKNGYRIVYGTFWGNDTWSGPLPYRGPTGNILRPNKVKGWYWYHEVMAAKRAKLISGMTIEEWVDYAPCNCDPPMHSVTELYNGRIAVGKNSPHGIARKLVYNSAYGKCAQSIGQPRFSNSVWASLITAGCRVQILDAIATHPTGTKSLLMVATDGIVFKEPHPNLDIDGQRLGAWDAETYENLSLFMPGLYWHDKAREQIAEGLAPQLKSRGVSARYLARIINLVDQKWRKYGPDHPIPRVELKVDWALVGAKEAIVRNAWHTCGQNVWNAKRVVDGNPVNKRHPDLHADTTTTYKDWTDPSKGVIAIPTYAAKMGGAWGGLRSFPYPEGDTLETHPYQPRFGADEETYDDVEMLITPDGVIGDIQAHAFGLRG